MAEETMEFATPAEAQEWAREMVDNDCVDNERFAFLDDEDAVGQFRVQSEDGCCGSFEREVVVAGRRALVGLNYGH